MMKHSPVFFSNLARELTGWYFRLEYSRYKFLSVVKSLLLRSDQRFAFARLNVLSSGGNAVFGQEVVFGVTKRLVVSAHLMLSTIVVKRSNTYRCPCFMLIARFTMQHGSCQVYFRLTFDNRISEFARDAQGKGT
jgi:hypothetical protein